jgi:hypothetical protein
LIFRKNKNTSQNNSASKINVDYLLKTTLIATPLIGLSALAHEWGYYSAFGIDLSLVPISVADQFKNILALIPSALTRSTALSAVILFLFIPSTNPTMYRRASFGFGVLGLIIFLIYFLFSNKQILRFEGLDMILMSILTLAFCKELGSSNKKIKYQTATTIFIIFSPFWLFTIGQTAALDFNYKSLEVYIHPKSTDASTTPMKAVLLRSYEKQIFVLDENQTPIFKAIDNISKIEIIQKPIKKGFLCEHPPKWCL